MKGAIMDRPEKPATPRRRARQTLAFLRDGEPSPTKLETVVSGPYRDRDKWRLIVIEGGKRKALIAATRKEAERIKAKLSQAITARADRTIGELLSEYEAYLTTERAARTAPIRRRQLERFLGSEQTIGSFTAMRAADLYTAECERLTVRGRPSAPAAHQTYLAESKRFFRWAVSKGYASSNPFADVRPVGRPKVGKTQLRIDEARRFVTVAMAAAQKGDRLALAALLALMLGARANEVLQRKTRDVDDGAAILWIPYGKTENAKRRLTLPHVVRPLVQLLTEGKPAEGYLFGTRRDPSMPYSDTRLWDRIGELCEEANVPRVCTHSLRGLHATLSVSAGMTSEHVAASLGHASFAITAKHYADASAIADRKTMEVAGTLLASKPTVAELIRLASTLSQSERDELRTALTRPAA
jgi:integrase